MNNPYPILPRDKGGMPMQEFPAAKPAFVVTAAIPPAASSVVTFGANTTAIEITTLNASLAIKWGSASVIAAAGATANFDHIIPVNSTRRFAIPVSVAGAGMSIVGANVLNGLYQTMAVIATTSVLTAYTEY